ncbi:adenylate kinase [Philodulcilactobacillus myokoensis]|uniref:Adenylate kinase n=1 Tax=Philodulcilactobacillus myokoensis TaxID=2929573 RepID=A0A9W6ERY6_9LACO|nr:adenylate kinase [Philodulcilactobacillus myokoensis]GLB46626.1 adenylate kinase [Philodulcilactobacillus myokoensis]
MAINLILLGLPGAGKGTQAQVIKDKYNIPHISTGDIFRAAIQNKTEMGLKAKKYIDDGQLVPDEVVCGIVKERLSKDDTKNGFMLDGFPRTLDQAKALEKMGPELNRSINVVININVKPDILVKRLSGRFICKTCGASYHKIYKRPKVAGTCDVCGGHEFFQREDDKPETVKKRLKVNKKMNAPLIDFYKQRHLLHDIDGHQFVSADKNIPAVAKDIDNVLDKL